MVRYRGTADVYIQYSVFDADTQDFYVSWDYENPEKIKCNITELNPDNVQELFSPAYELTKTIKLETDVPLHLSSRIGNLQLDVPLFPDMMFNIDNVQPRINYAGKVIGYRIICRYVHV